MGNYAFLKIYSQKVLYSLLLIEAILGMNPMYRTYCNSPNFIYNNFGAKRGEASTIDNIGNWVRLV